MTKPKTNFTYAGFKLDKINSKHELVPKEAKEIILPLEDRKALAIALKKDFPCLLIGETGTGKTSAIKYLAYLRKQPYVRVNMTGYTTPDELIGSKSAKNGSTYFEDGVITRAMRTGAILVIDELNATPPDSMFILHGLLDDDKQVTLPNGEVVKPHKDFRVFATMNPDYEGTKSVNRAFFDRWPIIIQVGVLRPKKEIEMLREKKIEKEVSENLVTIATMARKAYQEQKTITFVSTRSLLQVADLINSGLKPTQAYDKAIVKKARKNEQNAFKTFFSAVFKIEDKGDGNKLDDKTPMLVERGDWNRLTKENNKLKSETLSLVTRLKRSELKSAQNKDVIKFKEKIRKHLEKRVKEKERFLKAGTKPKRKSPLKIGDFVIVNKKNRYKITTKGWIGQVKNIETNLISVQGKDDNNKITTFKIFKADVKKI